MNFKCVRITFIGSKRETLFDTTHECSSAYFGSMAFLTSYQYWMNSTTSINSNRKIRFSSPYLLFIFKVTSITSQFHSIDICNKYFRIFGIECCGKYFKRLPMVFRPQIIEILRWLLQIERLNGFHSNIQCKLYVYKMNSNGNSCKQIRFDINLLLYF